jgi:hypothetical protein
MRTKISEFSATPGDNTDIDGIDIAEGCAPSGINNAIRELMAQLKDMQTGTSGDTFTLTTVNSTTVDTTNLEATNLKAKDGTAAGSIANTTGVVTLASSVLTTADINGGTVDGTTIGASSASTGAFTTLASNGATTFTAGTASTSTTTGTAVITGGLGVSGRINAANFDGIVGANTAAAGTFTNLEYTGTLTGGTGVVNLGSGQVYKDASGNVGLGSTAPQSRLTIQDAGSGAIISAMVRNGDASNFHRIGIGYNSGALTSYIPANAVFIDGSAGGGYGALGGLAIGTGSSAPVIFGTNAQERMRLDSSGNLLVGTTTLADNAKAIISFTGGSAASRGLVMTSGSTASTAMIAFKNPNGYAQGEILTSGSTTSYNTSSDYRLKENVAPLTGALKKIAALKPCTYTWKVDGRAGQGFIAHELQEVVPDCVTGTKDAIDKDGKPQYQGVDTSFLVATLVSAIQEQQALIQDLTTRLTALEAI